MGDDDNAFAVLDKVVHDLDELGDFLRCQRGGRLVEDQDVSAAVERLEDLDALLHADRDVLDFRVGVDGQAVALGDLHNIFPGGCHVQLDAPGRFGAQDDVLGDRKGLHQHKVLVDHADACINGIARIVHDDFFAVDQDIAGRGLEQTVELVHQRRFARAVFAQDRVDFALVDCQIDPVVGREIAEFLDDVPHFNDGRVHVHILFCQSERPL